MGAENSIHSNVEIEREKKHSLRRKLDPQPSTKHRRLETLDEKPRTVPISSIRTWDRQYNYIPKEHRYSTRLRPVSTMLNEKISLWRGKITQFDIDAIVNAESTPRLFYVDNEIVTAAGDYYLGECTSMHSSWKIGVPEVTGAYRLPCKYIINVLSPRTKDEHLLRQCYLNSLDLAKKWGIKTLAFPCIGSKVLTCFSPEQSGKIALECVRIWLEKNPQAMDRVILCVQGMQDYNLYRRLFQEYFPIHSNKIAVPDPPEVPVLGESEDVGELKLLKKWQKSKKTPGRYKIKMSRTSHSDSDGSSLFKWLELIYLDANDKHLSALPNIIYHGEDGIDAGGLTREFFNQALSTLTSQAIGGSPAFEGPMDRKLPSPSKLHLEKKLYEITGKILAHSVLHDGIGMVGMSPVLVYLLSHNVPKKKVDSCGLSLTVDDFIDMDVGDESLKTIFEAEDPAKLKPKQKEILNEYIFNCNLGCIGLNKANLPYIREQVILYQVVYRRWDEIESIREGMDVLGLYTLLCDHPTPEMIKIVFPTSDDLQISPSDLTKKIQIDDAKSDYESSYLYFTRLIDDMHDGKLGDLNLNTLLLFWTASPCLPRENLIAEVKPEEKLPLAVTCCLKLIIPGAHKKYEDFKESFKTALANGCFGFGKF